MGSTIPLSPFPPDEKDRFQALLDYHVLDTAPEPVFDEIAELAALICQTPTAVITLIDSKRQWFKARIGWELAEAPRESGFCSYTIMGRELFVVKDALADPRFAQNPLVKSKPHIRFYAGVPLVTPRDVAVGTLAVIDRKPRELDEIQRKALMCLARQVVAQLECRRYAAEGSQAFRAIVEASPRAIIAVDPAGRVLFWNRSAEAMFGFSRDEVLGKLNPIIQPDQIDLFQHWLHLVLNGQVLRDHEAIRVRKDGTSVEVSVSAAPIHNDAHQVFGVMVIMEDITERNRARKELQRNIALLRATLDATAEGILAVDREGRIQIYNRRLSELWHIPENLFASGNTNAVIENAMNQLRDPEHFLEKVRKYFAGEKLESFDTLRLKDGTLLERYAHPQVIGDEIVGQVFSYRDITKRTQLEEQLRHAQKMEALGQLAGGIAHDFNNLLNVIVGYTALIQARASTDETLCSHTEQVMKAADRAAALTRQLLVFGRKQSVEMRVLDLNELLTNLSKMLPPIIGNKIELVLRPARNLGKVKADAGQIEQVILNLVINARDAMPNGGLLVLETANSEVREVLAVNEPDRKLEYVVINVSDTGEGMSEEVKAHIFEPFFTTKQPGEGTGLGLATVYAIVHQIGGKIEVDSEVGRGTTMRVYLPRMREPLIKSDEARQSAPEMNGA